MRKYQTHGLFPIPVYMTDIDRDFTEKELQFVKDQKNHCVENSGNIHTKDNYILNRPEFKDIKNFIDECDSLLDIGAGGGTFVNMVKDKFSIVECQEISDICVDNLNKYGYNTYHGDFNSLSFDRTYDLVTCWQVLEHIKDLHGFVKNASKITNKYLVLEVPLLHSKGTRTRGIPSVDRWDGHYHFFSQKSMTKLFEQHFEILDLQEPGIQIPSLSVLLKKK